VSVSDTRLLPLVTPLHPGWVQAPSDGHGGDSTSVIGFAPLPETSRSTNGTLQNGSWHTFVWQSSDELIAPIQHLFTWMTVFGTVAIALLASLGYVAASRIVTPVRQLQQAAQSIGRGQLRSQIRIQTGDELQDLAEEFNRMNKQLEAAFSGLADQVQLKTEEVHYLQQSTDHILDTVPTPIVLIDAEERLAYANRAARDAFHVDLTAAMPLFTLLPIGQPAQDRLRQELRMAEDPSGVQDTEPASPGPRDPLTPATADDAASHPREIQIGARQYHYEWFRLPGRTGERNRIGLVLRDTTDESRLQDQLVQAEKSGSLGVLTAGIGHELNNPLFGIVGLGEAIQEEADLDRARSYARDIVTHGRRMAKIIRDFTGVATQGIADQRVAVCLEEEVDEALAAVQTTTDTKHMAVQKVYAGHTKVLALPDQLRQALAHLLTNAAQAMRDGGTLTLTTSVTGSLVMLAITDSGPGIAKQHLSKVFDPFFTTKGQGEGCGLGLTVARRIFRKFGGELRIESVEGRGTTCWVSLPVLAQTQEEGPWTTSAPQSEPQPSHSS
jgi:signal transduction histidine kinase